MGNEYIYGGYTNERGEVVTQEMSNISGIQTMITQVTNTDTGSVDTYVDKALDSQMQEATSSSSSSDDSKED
ncbi:MAG: hypothetical protein J5525_12580 [Lachnospiraceae bacterium]|nr:hypothetical protein [Lachnospiraceae bacterium]